MRNACGNANKIKDYFCQPLVKNLDQIFPRNTTFQNLLTFRPYNYVIEATINVLYILARNVIYYFKVFSRVEKSAVDYSFVLQSQRFKKALKRHLLHEEYYTVIISHSKRHNLNVLLSYISLNNNNNNNAKHLLP